MACAISTDLSASASALCLPSYRYGSVGEINRLQNRNCEPDNFRLVSGYSYLQHIGFP